MYLLTPLLIWQLQVALTAGGKELELVGVVVTAAWQNKKRVMGVWRSRRRGFCCQTPHLWQACLRLKAMVQ